MNTSTPSLTRFNPHDVPYQYDVIRDVRAGYDYGTGSHEVLLSGSVGCLREDALIETACGAIPISDIKPQEHVLSYSHERNQFCFSLSSGAFPKGKDYLYRVVTTHGEFVASAHHRIATLSGSYLSLEELLSLDVSRAQILGQSKRHQSSVPKSYLSNVLHYYSKLSSLMDYYVKRIHQYDPRLQTLVDIALESFPFRADAQEYGQFFYSHRHEHSDETLEQESKLFRNVELLYRQSMQNCKYHEVNTLLALGDDDFCSKLFEHILPDNQQYLRYLSHDVHPITLLFFLYRICNSLRNSVRFIESDITKQSILSIEKTDKMEWYWDLQVPNTNNYVSHGTIHHNSAKTILMAHLAITHCLMNDGARVLIGRRALPDLRDTLYRKIVEHVSFDLREGIDYFPNNLRACMRFSNGSEIIAKSWADKNYTKVRSLDLSMAVIEELTENHEDEFYEEISLRVGRLPHVKEQLIISATNPDSPSHWAYKRFMIEPTENRHVYYSLTEQNKFLPPQYIKKLKEDLDPKMAQRMLYGQWIDIAGETIYYQYDSQIHFKKQKYEIDKTYPIHFAFDFNIGHGKPLSIVFFQWIDDVFHFFDEVIIEGLRTEQACIEAYGRGLFTHDVPYYALHGDATGTARSTNSNFNNYEIITKFLEEKGIRYKYEVLKSNPPIKTRHNLVNAYMKNMEGQVRLHVWNCKTLDEGFRLTKLKDGAQYTEDDSKHYQHCTTAAGYGIYYCNLIKSRGQSGTIKL